MVWCWCCDSCHAGVGTGAGAIIMWVMTLVLDRRCVGDGCGTGDGMVVVGTGVIITG